ncbi:MAG: MmcQ/YjbR family DNA-binding protein [Saprospiraceae bacterium]|nr:MmcQ/YjbR family DNA-binding protein [Saprospiraceae bacterium]
MTTEGFINMVRAFPGTSQKPHFDRQAFRTSRRIYATLHIRSVSINVKLTPELQSVYVAINPEMIYPVPNKWGLQGWTSISLADTPEELIREMVRQAYEEAL